MPTTTTTTSYIIKQHKRASAQGMDLAEFRCAPYGKALKRHSKQRSKAPK